MNKKIVGLILACGLATAVSAFAGGSSNVTVTYDHPEKFDGVQVLPPMVKRAGAISLILWLSIATMGRLIAYYEPKDKDKPETAYVVTP